MVVRILLILLFAVVG